LYVFASCFFVFVFLASLLFVFGCY
jgi:hypothetical protein